MSPETVGAAFPTADWMVQREDWMLLAGCNDEDPEMFFPSRGDNLTADRARAICRECPVRSECEDYANRTKQKYGVWGGYSFTERRRRRLHGRR